MNRMIRTTVLALALWPALALAQAQPAAAPLPAWEQLTPAQRNALVAPLRERWNAAQNLRAADAREDKSSHRTRLHEKSEIKRPSGLTAMSSALRGGRVVTVNTPL